MEPLSSMGSRPIRLHWNGQNRTVGPDILAVDTPFHDSLGLYQSLLAQSNCQRVELVRVHCFCRNQMILGLQVVYASFFHDDAKRGVVETASPRLLFPAISEDIQRHTWEVDVGDSLQAVRPYGVPLPVRPECDIVKAISFQTQQGYETFLGAMTTTNTSTTSPEFNPSQTKNRVVALVATRDPEFGVINQIGFYYTKEPTETVPSNVPRDLVFHQPCGKQYQKIRELPLNSNHSSSQMIAFKLCSRQQPRKKAPSIDPYFSDLAFYQRLCQTVARVKLDKVCVYYNSHTIIRMFAIYKCWLRDGSTFESMPTEHAEWKHFIDESRINVHLSPASIRVFTVTLQSGEFISSISTKKHPNMINFNQIPLPGSFKEIALVTNRRSIHLEARLMKETRAETATTSCSYDRKVVALAGSINPFAAGYLHQIAYITQPTSWQILKPWILLWHHAARPANLALADATDHHHYHGGGILDRFRHKNKSKQKQDQLMIPKRWLLVQALVALTKQQRQPQQQQASNKGTSNGGNKSTNIAGGGAPMMSTSRTSTSTSALPEQEMVLHQLLQDMHQDAFRHILSYLIAPTPLVWPSTDR